MRRTIAFLFVASWASLGHGYDYASSCARPARAGRRAPAAPCDLSRHHYCTTPGTGYPWHAIRRFVRENQGLMRRMYGEERHIAVLKAELENFIEDDEEEEKKTEEFTEDIIKTKMMYTKKHHGDTRAMKVKPHFRPIQNTPDKNKKYDNDTLKVKPLSITKNITKVNNTDTGNRTEITNNETINEDKGISYKTRLESIANVEINNLDPDVITLEAVIKQSIETNSIIPSFPSTKSSATDINAITNDTVIEKDVKTTTEVANSTDQSTVSIDRVDVEDVTTTEPNKEDWKPMSGDTSTLPPTLLFSEHDKTKNVDNTVKKEETVKEEFHPKPVHHQETVRPAVIKLRGANACESKEEMAAPFWANSTRGEVLALLNMYPFEQYIHMETCVHERKQMYCREGCRCEQQYRLHRLLAYDPRNECRGIFADWFKFPACCVCKCYDVPLEFRARSPRILHPQYGEEVKRAIYEDVARDWYARSLDEEEDLF
ncbi:hypothetical protein JYU34_001388 [Plutella xylostella]|uniref:Spaetzle domain-containing protein n=1 Tax=Plutella xylostella TaxID=51655 RepID=A0ABQ7R3T1_PLUXY|nr:hypothetical protein JYU34_001388 [Plutella xylostella]